MKQVKHSLGKRDRVDKEHESSIHQINEQFKNDL